MTGNSGRRVRLVTVAVGVAGILIAAAPAAAQDISVNFGQGNGLTERVIQMIALLTVLSLAPSILVMMTSFTRIVVVLSLLRTALGTATAPPNTVIVSLALVLDRIRDGPCPATRLRHGRQAAGSQRDNRGAGVRARLAASARVHAEECARERPQTFSDMAKEAEPAKPEDLSLRILVPAFMISELKRAFEIGFLLFLPFLISTSSSHQC